MSLTIKHLNGDASFLLSFQPIFDSSSPPEQSKPFTILLDPWIGGPSKIWHPKFSISRQKATACISSLQELDPQPDLLVISQVKTDHCHEETLKQLPRSGGKTLILAEPASAKAIRGWKHFDAEKIVTLRKWELRNSSNIHRIPIPPIHPDGEPGEVTIAYISQKKDITGLHSAIGITYKPPSTNNPSINHVPVTLPPYSTIHLQSFPPTPPESPRSPSSFRTATTTHTAATSITSTSTSHSTSHPSRTKPLSIIFSPHGLPFSTLAPYITTHLAPTALPLTALLHPFDLVQNAWYMGGLISTGLPGGLAIARETNARVWVSAHDGDKVTTGFANRGIEVRRFGRGEVEAVVGREKGGTEAVVLEAGRSLVLSRMEEGEGGCYFEEVR